MSGFFFAMGFWQGSILGRPGVSMTLQKWGQYPRIRGSQPLFLGSIGIPIFEHPFKVKIM